MTDQILDIISEHMSTDYDTLLVESDADLIHLMGLVVDLEDDLNISISDNELIGVETVGQLVALVWGKLEAE